MLASKFMETNHYSRINVRQLTNLMMLEHLDKFENGSTYKCIIKMTDNNTLDIRGYIGVEALGRTGQGHRAQKQARSQDRKPWHEWSSI